MEISEIERLATEFETAIGRTKHEINPQEFGWYPYGTLNNFGLLNQLLTGANRNFLDQVGDGLIVDIGAADGDTAFFMESLGLNAHVADFPPTNFNSCRGVRSLKEALGSRVVIQEGDLDREFQLPAARYELAYFLGILYHLKNPFAALESLAKQARYAFVSTRVTRFNVVAGGAGPSNEFNQQRIDMQSVPAAYLVGESECNNDATNYWMFTNAGLRRVLHRAGWEVLDYANFGNTWNSDPATGAGDERAFCYLRSRYF
jgi:tRNA (mo5U34)-methyltransferase